MDSFDHLHLSTHEGAGSEGSRPLVVDFPWLVRQLDAFMGPQLNPEALHDLYYAFANVISQMGGGRSSHPASSPRALRCSSHSG